MSIDVNIDEFCQAGDDLFSPAICRAMRHELSHQALITRVSLLFHCQLSVSSSKVVDYFVKIRTKLRVLNNSDKLAITIRNVRAYSVGHREVEEVLESFKPRSAKSCRAFVIEINIELVLLSSIWEI